MGTNDDQVYVYLPVPEGADQDLFWWWMKTSYQDFEASGPKTEEYGAHDLEIMGMVLVLFGYRNQAADAISRAQAAPVGTELACWFYVLGKVCRLLSDYMAMRPGKADTWHDTCVYSMMARRIQEVGGWPG
jgi:hypothetical protein